MNDPLQVEDDLDIARLRGMIYYASRLGQASVLESSSKWKKYAEHNRNVKNFTSVNSQSRNPPETGLGIFDRLPVEVLQDLLVRLDVFTITAFRLVNRRAANAVESIPVYKTLLTHTVQTIRHVLRTGMGKSTSCLDLYEQLYEVSCTHCGGFGDLLWILTCKRICQPCLWDKRSCRPVWKYQAFSLFGLDANLLSRLPHLTARQPQPGQSDDPWEDFTVLWDHGTVRCLAIKTYGSIESAQKHARQQVEELREGRRKEHDKIHRLLIESGFGDHGYVSDVLPKPPCHERIAVMRLTATILYPSIDRLTHQLRDSFYCQACENDPFRRRDRVRKYDVASFKKHLTEYGDVRDGRHCLVPRV